MKWYLLKQNQCPKCEQLFGQLSFLTRGLITCSCGFKIRESRYSEIVNSQITKALEEKYDQEYNEETDPLDIPSTTGYKTTFENIDGID